MAESRKDSKGRKLRDGESQRNDGRYSYRYTDRTGKRKSIYAKDLPELRPKEKQLEKDLDSNIQTDISIKKLTLNALFARYLEIHKVSDSTIVNYMSAWNNYVRDGLGQYRIVQILPSDIKKLYAFLSDKGYAKSTIKRIHNLLHPVFEMAVDDDIIRKNPTKNAFGDYGREQEEKKPLTLPEQQRLMEFLKSDTRYNIYYPMVQIMLGTGVRCGELVGLTWNDVDFDKKEIRITHQLIYKNFGDGCKLHVSEPKTSSGIRRIPMSKNVMDAFLKQQEYNRLLNRNTDVEIDGYKDFIFITKNGYPYLPSSVNKFLYHIVDAINESGQDKEPFPPLSAHTMRHTFCTRMAENAMDIKVLQYVMGHANIAITMEVYNHIADMSRIEREIEKIESLAVGF